MVVSQVEEYLVHKLGGKVCLFWIHRSVEYEALSDVSSWNGGGERVTAQQLVGWAGLKQTDCSVGTYLSVCASHTWVGVSAPYHDRHRRDEIDTWPSMCHQCVGH